MAKDDGFEVNGVVKKVHSTREYEVLLENGKTLPAILSGKMKMHNIRILPGDKVTVKLSNYDLTQGRIIYRLK